METLWPLGLQVTDRPRSDPAFRCWIFFVLNASTSKMGVKQAAGLCKQDFVCDIGANLMVVLTAHQKLTPDVFFQQGLTSLGFSLLVRFFILGHESGLRTGVFQNYYCETKTISRSFDFYGWQHFTSITLGVSVWLNIIRP